MWRKENLARLQVTNGQNPFDHPGSIIRMTDHAALTYIWDGGISKALSGKRIGSVFELLIWRTLSSRIPIGSGKKINDSIPPAQYKVIDCPFAEEDKALYNVLAHGKPRTTHHSPFYSIPFSSRP